MASNALKLSRFLFSVLIILIKNNSITTASPLSDIVTHVEGRELWFVVSIGCELFKNPSNPYGHICGGALITCRHVITSEFCFWPAFEMNSYMVYAGSNDLATSQQFGIKAIKPYNTWLHRDVVGTPEGFIAYSDNDIAVVTLKEQVDQCHRLPRVANTMPVNLENVIIAGWGEHNPHPRHLVTSELRLIPRDLCISNIQRIINDNEYTHANNFFCTEQEFLNVDPTDRGSPVFIKEPNGEYLIIGLHKISFPAFSEGGVLSQQHKHIGVPYYSRFINSVIANTP